MKIKSTAELAVIRMTVWLGLLAAAVAGRGSEAFVISGSEWKFLDTGTDPGAAWRAPAFDDSAWPSGPSQLGFGDGDERTMLRPGIVTAYFRAKFNVIGAASVSNLTLRVLRDDGVAVYLNGVEVFRNNLPAGPLTDNTLATATVGGADEMTFVLANVSSGLVLEGENTLAAEVHQVNVASSDLSFDLELTGQLGGTNNPPPAGRPLVTVTEPANGATFVAPTSVVFSAQAIHDPVSTSRWLDLYLGTNRVGGTAGGGLNVTQKWTVYLYSLPAGDHVLTATAHDNLGHRGTSAPVTITITIPPNTPPAVRIVSPLDGGVLAATSALPIRAEAVFDPASTMKSLEWHRDFHLCTYRDYGTNNVVGGTCIDYIAYPGSSYIYTAVASDNFGNFVTSPPVRVTIVSNLPPAGGRELHVVGIYSGALGNGPVPNHETGDAAVSVKRNGKRVTLYLVSYEPTRWHLSVAPGTTIERVFTSSYYTNILIGLPAGVPVITTRLGFAGYSLDSTYYLRTLPRLCADTGQDLSSFHGSYTAPYPTPFVIDGVQSDPRLRCDYPQPAPTNNLPAINFRLAFHGAGRGLYFQNYTLAGPEGGGSALPDQYAVPDSNARFYYAADPFFVWRIDGPSGDVRNMELPPTVPELSWPMGVAFDSLRQRALLVSLGGEGFLYAYAPAQDAWSLVSSMNHLDLDAFAYHAPSDSLFGVDAFSHDDVGPTLHELSADGQPRRRFQLPALPWWLGPRNSSRSELVSVGEYLVWLLAPRVAEQTEQESRMYLIDPRTGEIWLTYRRIPPPNSPPVVSITSPSNGAVFSTEEALPLAAHVSDPDGAIVSVEFFLNGNSQGNAGGPNGSTQGIWVLHVFGLPPGSYRFTAKATDNFGAMTASAEITFTVRPPPDADGDGVPDSRDRCPDTSSGAVVNEHGCSLAQLCPCDGGWRNHGEYVRCVIDHSWQFFRAGLITTGQRRALIRDAARSNCGRRPPAAKPMQLHLLPLTPDECRHEGVRFVVSGDAAGECVVETSTDLTNWTPWQIIPATDMGNEVACPHSSGEPARFFRVRILAP